MFFKNILKSDTKSNFVYDKINNLYNLFNFRQNKIYDEKYFTNRRIVFPDGTERFDDEPGQIIDKNHYCFLLNCHENLLCFYVL